MFAKWTVFTKFKIIYSITLIDHYQINFKCVKNCKTVITFVRSLRDADRLWNKRHITTSTASTSSSTHSSSLGTTATSTTTSYKTKKPSISNHVIICNSYSAIRRKRNQLQREAHIFTQDPMNVTSRFQWSIYWESIYIFKAICGTYFKGVAYRNKSLITQGTPKFFWGN